MGWDIRGWVEVHLDWMEGLEDIPGVELWHPVVDCGPLLGRNYHAFNTLFGVVDHSYFDARFTPIAERRGLPPQVSRRVAEDAQRATELDPGAGFCWPTWVTWAELEQVDWDEYDPTSDLQMHEYVRDEHGAWVEARGPAQDKASPFAVDHEMEDVIYAPEITWTHGQEWLIQDRLYKVMHVRRRDALDDE